MMNSGEHVSKQKLMDDLNAVVNDAEELLKASANQTGERITAARAKAEESLKTARTRLSATQEALTERAKMMAKDADAYVHENPWKAAGVAAAAGILIGALIARR
jgi:ElaB/YqjD/DUF883 family membrane-anchored ribosome-binding protein